MTKLGQGEGGKQGAGPWRDRSVKADLERIKLTKRGWAGSKWCGDGGELPRREGGVPGLSRYIRPVSTECRAFERGKGHPFLIFGEQRRGILIRGKNVRQQRGELSSHGPKGNKAIRSLIVLKGKGKGPGFGKKKQISNAAE